MQRCDVEYVGRGVGGLREGGIGAQHLVEAGSVAEERGAEDVVPRAVCMQHGDDALAVLPARRAQRRDKQHALHPRRAQTRLQVVRFVDVDVMFDEQRHRVGAPGQRRVLQQARGIGGGGQPGCCLEQRSQRGDAAAARQGRGAGERACLDAAPGDPCGRGVDQRQRQRLHLSKNLLAVSWVGHGALEGPTEVSEPAIGERGGDGQIVMTVLQGAIRALAVPGFATQPLREEDLLVGTVAAQVAVEQRPQRTILFDAVVQPVHKYRDAGVTAIAREQFAAAKRPRCMAQKRAVDERRTNILGRAGV